MNIIASVCFGRRGNEERVLRAVSLYEAYRDRVEPVPSQILRWNLYGAGLENLGRAGQPEWVPTPVPGPRQLLARMDAVGICYSDVKIVQQGEHHPRLIGRELKRQPVVMGHEVACTLVRVGEELQDRFQPGQRYILQADVVYQGQGMAVGYLVEGGFTQYGLITEPVIFGDEGCYLLPIAPHLSYAEAALVEPWACVVASYRIQPRRSPKRGGRMLVIAQGEPTVEYQLSCLQESLPASLLSLGAAGKLRAQLSEAASRGDIQWIELQGEADRLDWHQLRVERTQGAGFDDILLYGALSPEVVQNALDSLARGGTLVIVRHTPLPPVALDVGRLHYDGWMIVGTTCWDAAEAYRRARTSALVPGGQQLILGAGGPMGQMHLHYALHLPEPPRHLVAVDRHSERLNSLKEQFDPLARSKGVRLTLLDNAQLEPEEFEEVVWELSDGYGYTDILSLSSMPEVLLSLYPLLTEGGLLNLFAGLPRGTRLALDLSPFWARQQQIVGSSGSSLADLAFALQKTEAGELPTRRALAAIGGLRTLREGLVAVKEHRFTGKIILFPNLPDLPLLSLQELRTTFPTVYERLEEGRFWTLEAEKELFERAVVPL